MKNYKELALRNIKQRGMEAKNVYDKQIKVLYQDENFKQIMKDYTTTVIQNARKSAYGEIPDYEKEGKLKHDLDIFLRGAKINAKPKYFCNKCDDSGFDGMGLCKCVKTEMTRLMMEDNGFEKLQSFEESIKNVNGENKKFYEKMIEWCDCADRTKKFVFICGEVGVGKTHLQKCIGKRFLDQGKIVKFVSSVKFALDTKKLEDEIISDYSKVQVLMIDDLGKEVASDTMRQALHIILSERKERDLITVISSNFRLSDIAEKYGESVVSRLADREISICFEMVGEDRRRKPIFTGNDLKETLDELIKT